LTSVDTMKTAKTASTPVTINDCALVTNLVPTTFTPTITSTIAVMKKWFQKPLTFLPTKSDVA
jgi:hypothetical protein